MNFKKSIINFSISFIVFFISGELIIRFFDFWNNENLHQNTSVKDEKLGWKCKENYTVKRIINNKKTIEYSTTKNGFKSFSSDFSFHKNIFFIGDSFTQAVEVGNAESFYEILKDSLDFNLFAYGMSGFGTLQEKIILDIYAEKIKPDLVVLQFCTNDFIDNYYELNRECNYKINSTRPYQQLDKSIIYKNPFSTFERLISNSKFLTFVFNQLKKISQKYGFSESGEYKIASQKENYKPFASAVKITRNLIKTIKSNLPQKTKLLVFLRR